MVCVVVYCNFYVLLDVWLFFYVMIYCVGDRWVIVFLLVDGKIYILVLLFLVLLVLVVGDVKYYCFVVDY